MVKVLHYRLSRYQGNVDARAHIFAASALGRGSVASPYARSSISPGKTIYSFYRRLSGLLDQSGKK